MAKYFNQLSCQLCTVLICNFLIFGVPDAAAQFVTALDKAPSQVRICPSKKCLQVFEHPFKPGKKIVIYEKKNGWVRLSGIIAPEHFQAKFSGKKLPTNAAHWIPSVDLPSALATQFHSEETKPDAKPKPVVYAILPKTVPVPARRPARQFAATTAPSAKPVVVENKPALKPVKAEVKPPAVEAKNEPKGATDIFGNPVVKLPSKLTKELKDKRLAKLPSRPKSNLELKSVIAIRYHGLRLLNDGSCKAIREGGKSLSLAGWIYVICEGDGQYRQFSVE